MVKRRHLVAEVRHVPEPVLVGGNEILELRARVAATRHDAHLEALLRELRAALGLDRVGNELHGIDLRDLLDFLDLGLANELRVLRTAALDVDERTFEVDAGDLGIRHTRVGVGLGVLRGGNQLAMRDCERRREHGRHTLRELRLRELENRLGVGVAEVVAERTVGMDVNEAGHHVLPAHVDDGRVRVGLDGLRALEDLLYLLALDDDRGFFDVDAGGNDVCVYDYGLLHFLSPFLEFLPKWRRVRDSNPRRTCILNGFQDRRVQPLRQLSFS